MADLTQEDEDDPHPTSKPPDSTHTHTANNNDTDLSDETQDFRFLTNLSQYSTTTPHTLPKRGEKDFEPNPTTHQSSTLAASREAMHTALSHPRVHAPKNHIIATYHPDKNQCFVKKPKGPHFRTIGRGQGGGVWLLPEEAIWLCERGGLDVRWAAPSNSGQWKSGHQAREGEDGEEEAGERHDEDEGGIPMSLQAVYACMLEDDEETGLSLERYTVYAGLRRNGYSVLRADSFAEDTTSVGKELVVVSDMVGIRQGGGDGERWGWGIFARVFGSLFKGKESVAAKHERERAGPLVKPGLYRNYNDIYRLLSLIPHHNPTLPPSSSTPTTSPFRIAYNVYKPSPKFKKTCPGPPDFRIAVINARTTCTPTLTELSALLESTPYAPPPDSMKNKNYQRLRHGYRNCVLAIVDQGVVSYLRIGDAGFGLEKMYEQIGRGGRGGRGGKRVGRGGRGRGR